eukprot:scaffold31886_cov66-Attheya_sp.AAC.7
MMSGDCSPLLKNKQVEVVHLRDKKKWKRISGISKLHDAALDDDADDDDDDGDDDDDDPADEAGDQMKTKKKKGKL